MEQQNIFLSPLTSLGCISQTTNSACIFTCLCTEICMFRTSLKCCSRNIGSSYCHHSPDTNHRDSMKSFIIDHSSYFTWPPDGILNSWRHLCPILWKIIIIDSYISYMPKNTNSMWNILNGNVIYPIACVWLLEGANCEDSPTFEIGLVFLCNHVQASPFTSGETCTIWIWQLLSTSISLKANALKKQRSWN